MRSIRGLLCSAMPALALVVPLLVQAAPVQGQGTWETTLQARDLTGDGVADAYYDTSLNITWLRNWSANKVATAYDARAWATSLDINGISGWRLPTILDTGPPGCQMSFGGVTDCGFNVGTAGSELAHMYYVTLGNLAYCLPGYFACEVQPGFGLSNTADFLGTIANGYWSGSDLGPNTNGVWYFSMSIGLQGLSGADAVMQSVAVRNGDVGAAIPEPATYGLALIALVMLGLSTRHRKH